MLLHADLDTLFADINFYLLPQIKYKNLNLLIDTNIYHCKVSFFVFRAGTIIRRSTTPLEQHLLGLQGISFHF
jgi:hypothetical protein